MTKSPEKMTGKGEDDQKRVGGGGGLGDCKWAVVL